MLSNYVLPGDRIELQSVNRSLIETETKRIYETKVFDILSNDKMEIVMPMDRTKLILLPVDAEYDIHFYTKSGLFQCFARVIDRYKSNNVYILALELTSNLRKHQRREYYRFSCALEMNARNLKEEEVIAIDKNAVQLVPGLPLKRSVIVDISGGGLRFVSTQRYEVDSLIYCNYQLLVNGKTKEYNLVGKILKLRELDNRPGEYEHRIQYVNIDMDVREEIIKYIFEEERKYRRREKG
jgi:c-di-GMP-binding flagellar brake protein YcgR